MEKERSRRWNCGNFVGLDPHFLRVSVFSAASLAMVACGAPERPPVTSPSKPAPSTPNVTPEAVRAEHPVTSARTMLMTEFALAPHLGEQYRERRAFPLATGGAGFLTRDGSRAVATLSQVNRIELPSKLRDLCVATNGKTTIATTQDSGAAQLWMADSFDGPMRLLGSYLTEIRRQRDDEATRARPAWIFTDGKATSLVDCESGKVEQLAPPVAWARENHWTDTVQILELRTEKPQSTYCLVRTSESTSWSKHPDCYVRPRGDGSVAVETQSRPPRTQPKCAFVVDEQGKKAKCDSPIGPPPKQSVMRPNPRTGDTLQLGRFFAPSKAVVLGVDGGMFHLGADGKIDNARRLGPPSLQACSPLLPTLPVYRCTLEGKFDVVMNVDSSGQVREELRRRRGRRSRSGARRKKPSRRGSSSRAPLGGRLDPGGVGPRGADVVMATQSPRALSQRYGKTPRPLGRRDAFGFRRAHERSERLADHLFAFLTFEKRCPEEETITTRLPDRNSLAMRLMSTK
jgi:hypothetical protein